MRGVHACLDGAAVDFEFCFRAGSAATHLDKEVVHCGLGLGIARGVVDAAMLYMHGAVIQLGLQLHHFGVLF